MECQRARHVQCNAGAMCLVGWLLLVGWLGLAAWLAWLTGLIAWLPWLAESVGWASLSGWLGWLWLGGLLASAGCLGPARLLDRGYLGFNPWYDG